MVRWPSGVLPQFLLTLCTSSPLTLDLLPQVGGQFFYIQIRSVILSFEIMRHAAVTAPASWSQDIFPENGFSRLGTLLSSPRITDEY